MPSFSHQVPGAKEHCVTSDDIFALKSNPGKTLVIGASYVALECAGFIAGTGLETTIMMRSIPLRGFDQQMAMQIKTYMEEHGIAFIDKAVPEKVELSPSGKKLVTWKHGDGTTGTPGVINPRRSCVPCVLPAGGLALHAVGRSLHFTCTAVLHRCLAPLSCTLHRS